MATNVTSDAATLTVNVNISVSANPTAGGTVSGDGTYQHGQNVTLVSTANTGYTFVNWTENGNPVGTNPTLTFTATANRTLVANFELKPTVTITVATEPEESGEVSGGGVYCVGDEVTIEATDKDVWEFVEWQLNGNFVSNEATYTFTATVDATYTAIFKNIGISVIGAPVFNIYPNPAHDHLTVQRTNGDKARIEIYNSSAALIQAVEIDGTQQTVDIATLAAGVYVIRLVENNSISTKQFVKE